MTVGCWNVRTLHADGTTTLLLHELEKFKWDIIGIAETHWLGVDDRRYNGCRILSSGREKIHRSGVALALSPLAEKSLLGYNPVTDRIMSARFKTTIGTMTVCQIYAPTSNAEDEEMDDFYDKLQEVISAVPTLQISWVTTTHFSSCDKLAVRGEVS
jgi:exonuclease III